MSEEEAWPFIRDVYEGLQYLNSKGIIHRDLKAANVFVKEGKAKIADFGLSITSKYKYCDLEVR